MEIRLKGLIEELLLLIMVLLYLQTHLIMINKINYDKNNELIITFEKSEAIIGNITINAVNFKYDKNKNILNAINDVKIIDKINDYSIFSENVSYTINKEIIFSA